MNKTELQAIADKREANIQKLQNYLNAGKTAEEKVVANLIKNIKKAEKQLTDEGYMLESMVNEDGTLTDLQESFTDTDASATEENTTVVTEDTTSIEDTIQDTIEDTKDNEGNEGDGEKDSATKIKNSKKNKPIAKLRDGSEVKKETVKLGVSIKESTKDRVDMLAEDNSMKANEVVVELLNRVFNGKDFTVNFDKKEDTKITSFNIPPEINKAIEKVNKKTGIPKSEIFNKLLDEAMKEFYNN